MLKRTQILAAMTASVLLAACSGAPDEAALANARADGVAAYKAQLEENKRVASEFFREGITAEERNNLIHEGYIQHNPAAKKMADEAGVSYKEGFAQMAARFAGMAPPPPPAGAAAPPAGNQLYMVLAEDDLVFIMREQYRQDPTAEPGTFYASYGWDVFRVKDGKLFEHWDGALINPPNAGGPPGAPGAARGPG